MAGDLGVIRVRNRDIGGRNVTLRRRNSIIGRERRRKLSVGRDRREGLGRKVGIGARKVGVVVVVVVARNLGVIRVRNATLRKRKLSIGRGRNRGLGKRRNKAPFITGGWRERDGSCNAGKNE